jgi:Gamma-glutamyl cyclotransferase, AIG2-like
MADTAEADFMDFIYFAYGSNMLTERLLDRCPGAKPIGMGIASGYRVAFCLESSDGSAKAGLLPQSGARAGGVLYRIPESEGPALDKVEGHPHTYQRHETLKVDANGKLYDALTYLPHEEKLATDHAPYDWYRALCLAGGEEHGVPNELIAPLIDTRPILTDLGDVMASTGREIARAALLRAGRNDWFGKVV